MDRNFMLEDIKEDVGYEDDYEYENLISKTPIHDRKKSIVIDNFSSNIGFQRSSADQIK